MSAQSLLVELFTEELPPKALHNLGSSFAQALSGGLHRRGLLEAGSTVVAYATPRRLAALIRQVRAVAPDEAVVRKLMPVSVGLDAEGRMTAALAKKLAALGHAGLDAAALDREGDGKAAQLILRDTAKGVSLETGLQAALDEALTSLPVPKLMSYQLADGETTVQFVRPAHGLVALHGEQVVPVAALGLEAGRTTHGHRFQGAATIELDRAEDYETRLQQEGGVLASFEARRNEIHRMLRLRADEQDTTLGEYDDYQALLDEVTALVEMPTVYVGDFDREFLEVPAECLILTMKLNQKYFPLFLNEGGLSSRFLVVSNMRLDDPTPVIEGNERVVRPRLADARFFFETDKKTRLEQRVARLFTVVYHNKLGSQGDRVARVRTLAQGIARAIGADAALADRAALLAKADLTTDMVGEFPELQGVMGRYYALHDGESPVVADAIAEHYQPRFSGDRLPGSPVALAVAMADKMETLAGLFGIGQQPSGDKDPFALRRHALGVLRMLIEKQQALPLGKLVDLAYSAFPPGLVQAAYTDLENFLLDRLRGLLREQGHSIHEIEAVIGNLASGVHLAPALLAAVRAFAALPEAASLAAANKRIGNLLKKADQQFAHADPARFCEPAEQALNAALAAARPVFERHYGAGDYTAALQSLAPLRVPVDTFFDQVMVNVEDNALRINRLALLGDLHALMNRVADLSKLAG